MHAAGGDAFAVDEGYRDGEERVAVLVVGRAVQGIDQPVRPSVPSVVSGSVILLADEEDFRIE
ncbi:MAG: hypothetical protein AO395_02605 [Candidatus Fermentibacter daniensis]|nr:MAG: hypothetical protein AO395_02605 [Candidatus Fermentibacter daniensis]